MVETKAVLKEEWILDLLYILLVNSSPTSCFLVCAGCVICNLFANMFAVKQCMDMKIIILENICLDLKHGYKLCLYSWEKWVLMYEDIPHCPLSRPPCSLLYTDTIEAPWGTELPVWQLISLILTLRTVHTSAPLSPFFPHTSSGSNVVYMCLAMFPPSNPHSGWVPYKLIIASPHWAIRI